MKTLIISVAALLIVAAGAIAQTMPYGDDWLLPSTPDSAPDMDMSGLKKVLSDKPFFGTQNMLTLNGSYVNTPREDFLQTGKWNLPLTLDQMDGVIGELSFGEAEKQGEWQLTYRYRLMNTDTEWQAIAASADLTISDRRSQVLKASYSIRDWWRLGLAAMVEDRQGADVTTDPSLFGTGGRNSLGFQIDTSLKF
jgi:hypothetical protein